MDDSIVRILIATDNHLGFMEKDAVRYNDSFAAFEEIFLTAKSKRADFVLLAGDTFHENKVVRIHSHTFAALLISRYFVKLAFSPHTSFNHGNP